MHNKPSLADLHALDLGLGVNEVGEGHNPTVKVTSKSLQMINFTQKRRNRLTRVCRYHKQILLV